jgi:UDP:flavonoid glycosyltransferase YjiC (YdhE family)
VKVFLCTLGGPGRILPMAALAQALNSTGHKATVVCPRQQQHWANMVPGVPVMPLDTDKSFDRVEEFRIAHRISQAVMLHGHYFQAQKALTTEVARAAFGADVLVTDYTCQQLVSTISASMNCPAVFLAVHPTDLYTEQAPRNVIRAYSPFIGTGGTGALRPSGIQFAAEQEKQALDDFIAAGEPPIAIAVNSPTPADREGKRKIAGQLADAMKRRVILVEPGATKKHDNPNVLETHADHSELFPLCACVIHDSGVGVTQAAFRAGVPSVLVPATDEDVEVYERTCMLAISTRVDSSTDNPLAEFVDGVNEMMALRSTAERVAQVVAQEDGTGSAVKAILSLGPSHPALPITGGVQNN